MGNIYCDPKYSMDMDAIINEIPSNSKLTTTTTKKTNLKLPKTPPPPIPNNNNNNNNRKFHDFYKILHKEPGLGNGSFAKVKKCIHKQTKKEFAVKIINKNLIPDKLTLDLLKNEIKILFEIKKDKYPNIIHVYDVFENENNIKIVLELCHNKTLLDFILLSSNKRFNEFQSSLITHLIARSLHYLHSKNICHRDLKPSNILFNKYGQLKIIDFGLSKKLQHSNDSSMKTSCGTPIYCAPEIILSENKQSYSTKVDLWSLGALLFIMLSGKQPFFGKSLKDVYEKIKNGCYSFKIDPEIWNNISIDAKDLIQNLLVVDPNLRYSAKQALEHPFITKYDFKSIQNNTSNPI